MLAFLSTACGGSSPPSPATHSDPPSRNIRLQPGTYTFPLGGRVNAGDTITCVTADGAPAGGGTVPKSGGVGSSTGFVAVVSSGEIRVTCPAHLGIM